MGLYELTGQYLELQELIDSGEYDDEILADSLEAVNGELEMIADNYARIIVNLTGKAAVIDAEIKRLKDRKTALENGVKRIKEDLYKTMITVDKRKIKTDSFSFTIQKNGGALPVVVDVETWKLPDELVKIEEKPDLKAIAKLLEDNPERGKLYGHFGERGESLRIR